MRSSWFLLAPLVLLSPGVGSRYAARARGDEAPAEKTALEKFSSAEGKFSILLPGTPKKQTQKVGPITVVMYGADVKDGAFAVGYTILPPGTPFNLKGAIQGIASSQGKGKVLSEKDFTLAGEKGKEFEASISRPRMGFVSGRVIVVNGRLYQALVVGTKARLSNPEVRKYLDSLEISR